MESSICLYLFNLTPYPVKRGLGIESTNADLKKMSRELEEALRLRKVDSAISQAESQIAANDIPGAMNTIKMAQRLDPDNKKLNALLTKIKPVFDRLEKERLSCLDSRERLKEQGDAAFKAANFEAAIVAYTKALDSITDKVSNLFHFTRYQLTVLSDAISQSSELALKCYGNRAACYKQLSNFDGTISDCTAVLEHKPDDVKSLVRRAQAFEACERYKSALQDVRLVLSLGLDVVGKSSYDLANGMQHRLNRVIAQLKS